MTSKQTSEQKREAQALPPSSAELEEALLGSLLVSLRPESLNSISVFLAPDDFFIVRHGWIYEAIKDVSDNGLAVDSITVAEALRQKGRLDSVGGPAYLAYLMDVATATPTLGLASYAKLVKMLSVRRQVIDAASRIATAAFDQGQRLQDVLSQAFDLLKTASNSAAGILSGPGLISDGLEQFIESLDERIKAQASAQGNASPVAPGAIGSGYNQLDELTSGWSPQELVIIAGRPGMGKSAALLSLALNAAKAGKVVLFESLEMDVQQLLVRLVSQESRVDIQNIRRGLLTENQYQDVLSAIWRLGELNIYFSERPQTGLAELRQDCDFTRISAGRLDLVVCDYLQLFKPDPAASKLNREGQVALIADGMKAIARAYDCPVLCAAQLNRAVEQRQDKRPQLSDLRESGAIEQSADMVIFLYRDDVYNGTSPVPGTIEFIIAKNRNGATGQTT